MCRASTPTPSVSARLNSESDEAPTPDSPKEDFAANNPSDTNPCHEHIRISMNLMMAKRQRMDRVSKSEK